MNISIMLRNKEVLKMYIDITNIPKDKFAKIQGQVLIVLYQNGLSVDSIPMEDVSENFIGFEFEIQEK